MKKEDIAEFVKAGGWKNIAVLGVPPEAIELGKYLFEVLEVNDAHLFNPRSKVRKLP
jgi:hypothetical protein